MTARWRVRAARTSAVRVFAALLVTTLAGCSSEGPDGAPAAVREGGPARGTVGGPAGDTARPAAGSAAVPPGFLRHRSGGYTFGVPADWAPRRGSDRGRPTLTFYGPALRSGVRDGHLHVARWDRYPEDLNVQLAVFRGMATLNGYRLTVNAPVRMAGARRAHRFEAVYRLRSAKGESVWFRLAGLYVLDRDRTLLEFLVRAPAGGVAEPRLGTIVGTLRARDGR